MPGTVSLPITFWIVLYTWSASLPALMELSSFSDSQVMNSSGGSPVQRTRNTGSPFLTAAGVPFGLRDRVPRLPLLFLEPFGFREDDDFLGARYAIIMLRALLRPRTGSTRTSHFFEASSFFNV